MSHKDSEAAKASKRAYYLTHKEKWAISGAKRNIKRQAIAAEKRRLKALEPVVVVQRTCLGCTVDITHTYIRKHGCYCTTCHSANQKAYREANKASIAESKRLWKIANAAHVAARDKAYAAANPEKRVVARAKWDNANPGMLNACKQRNSYARKKRVPTWLSEDDIWMIAQAYELAALRTKMFGYPWHVDHVIPLNGKKVSGLHVPNNLQVIPGADNIRKHNNYEVA